MNELPDAGPATRHDGDGAPMIALNGAELHLASGNGDVNILRGIDLSIGAGETVGVVGPSGSGKSTVANVLEQKLHSEGRHTYLLDGDNVRHGLCRDLGFTDADRVENIRRVAEVARLMADAGLIVIASFISPFANEREMARLAAGDILFVEAFVDTPLAVCESRDPKGLYKKARTGELKNFTGIDSAYEAPSRPEITLHGAEHTPEVLADQVAEYLSSKNVFSV